MALLPLRVFAYSSCDEFYETKRLTQIDLLPARIPQMGVGVDGAFNKLKKTREMFWSGRRDLNSEPPAPKTGKLAFVSPLISTMRLKTQSLVSWESCGWVDQPDLLVQEK